MKIKIHPTLPEHRACYPCENFYATVDGKNVGEKGTMFYNTKREAEAVARRFIIAMENSKASGGGAS